MNTQDSSLSFQNLPMIYENEKNQILNSNLKPINTIYSQLNFSYLKCPPIQDKIIEEQIKDLLLNSFKDIKFFTYEIKIININNANVTICSEDECHIIESINSNLFTQILQNTNSSKIDVNENIIVKEEINSFFASYYRNIDINKFVPKTINPIIGYFIRRYYYPSNFFKNQDFFYFNQKHQNLTEKKLKGKISNFISEDKSNLNETFPSFSKQILKEIKNENVNEKSDKTDIKEFDEFDFIHIKSIGQTQESSIILVMHIDTLYICAMKVCNYSDREIDFCYEYSHHCLLKFLGFVRSKISDSLVGGIYEFMSNGDLSDFLISNKTDDFFSFMTLNRLFQGIEYLHSKSYVHRDLKPTNILIDHDFVPYISDFDTIKTIDFSLDTKTTQDIGIFEYASPEQLFGSNEKLNFSTDIYSFGQLIYLLYEKENMIKENDIDYVKKTVKNIPKMKNASESIQDLCQKCVSFEPENRPKINQIKLFIYEQLKQLNLNEQIHEENKTIVIQYIYENIIFLHQITKDDLYEFGLHYTKAKEFLKAKEYYEMAAEQKHADSLFQLGKMYYSGNGVGKDVFKAKDYYQLGSDLKSWKCDLGLGEIYLHIYNDVNKMIYYFNLAGPFYPQAYRLIGVAYFEGYKIETNYQIAKKYFDLAAEKNDYTAISYLGMMYLEGKGVEKDLQKAKDCFEKSAKNEEMIGCFHLGLFYYEGILVKQDEEKAMEYFILSAKQHYHSAYFYLGEIYRTSNNIKRYPEKSFECYKKAAEYGLTEANAMVAYMYYTGEGVEKDIEKSIKYFEIASDYGNSIAQFNLGDIYFNGDGVKKDYQKAKHYFELSAKNQNVDSIFYLGVIYYEGKGVEQDYQKSFKYFENSGNQNHLPSLYYLGLFYLNGMGLDHFDISKAIDSFSKCSNSNIYKLKIQNNYEQTISEAIENNDYYLPSINNLGLIYLLELDNKEEAEKYLGDSGRSSYSCAQNNLGLFNQYFLNNINEAIHFFERALEGKFALAEYNIGYIEENENKNIDSAIEHYKKSLETINSPLKYKQCEICDERFDISKSFISCFINLKLTSYYFSQSNFEIGVEYFLKAVFQNLFKFLFQNNKDSCIFEFNLSNQQSEVKLDLNNFFLNFPLFNLSSQASKWTMFQSNQNEKIAMIQFHKSNDFQENTQEKNSFDSFNQITNIRPNRDRNVNNVEPISDDFVKNAFMEMNYKDQFEFVEFNEENDMKVFKFKSDGDDIEKILKYPKDFKEFLFNNLNDLGIEINDIVNEMNEILHKKPYKILFGRIDVNNKKIISENQNNSHQNINSDFIEGFEL